MNLDDRLHDELDSTVDDTSLARIVAAAHQGADRRVRNARLGIGAGSAVAVALAATLALNLGATPPRAGAETMAPAGPGTASATTAVAPATTTPANPVRTSAAPQKPAATYKDKFGYTVVKDFPVVAPNPKLSPLPSLPQSQPSDASSQMGYGPGGMCNQGRGIVAQAATMVPYYVPAPEGVGDGDTSPALDRSRVILTTARFVGGPNDLVAAFLGGKLSCVPSGFTTGKTLPASTVPGADRVWTAPITPNPLYPGYQVTAVMVQKGRYLISVETSAKGAKLTQDSAFWFAKAAVDTVAKADAR